MLNYELCKKLKEAGFPESHKVGDENYPIAPTLEKLIEAVGDNLQNINRVSKNEWWAGLWVETEILGKKIKMEKGNTVEEAVANLWLSLNEK